MKIALVDDDPRALAQLEQYLTEQLGRETEISHYGSGEALLADCGPAPSSWWCWISTWAAQQAWRWPAAAGRRRTGAAGLRHLQQRLRQREL